MVGEGELRGGVVLLEAEMLRVTANARTVSPAGSRWSPGTPTSITKHPPASSWAATFWKQATYASWVVRFMIVLRTR